MTIEEKAYDEALEQAKKELAACGSMDCDAARLIFRLFPELRESEDERMMREFNDWLCEEIECRTNDLRDEKDRRTLNMLCYILTKVKERLEKQKEQKPVDFPTTDEEVNEFLETHPKVEVPEKYKTPDFVFKKQEYESYPIISKDTTSVKPAEWSEEDKDMLNSCISSIEEAKENRYAYKETDGDTSYDHEIAWLKSLRPVSKESLQPQQNMSIGFMLYLDEHRPEGKMSLSNAECEDIDKAFKENDLAKIVRYYEKYRPHWKPSEEQMKMLAMFSSLRCASRQEAATLESLYNDLKRLM